MAVEIKLLGCDAAAVLTNSAPGVFDDQTIPLVTEVFLNDAYPDKPCSELWINEIGVAPTHGCLPNDQTQRRCGCIHLAAAQTPTKPCSHSA